jgi:hypothetical protein
MKGLRLGGRIIETMNTTRIPWVCAIALTVGAAVALAGEEAEQSRPQKAVPRATKQLSPGAAEKSPVICHLERRNTIITVKAGPSGPLYLVKTKAGKVLHQDVTEEQLRAQAPDLHAFVKTALAGRSGKPGVVLDASLGRRPSTSDPLRETPASARR